MLRADFQKASVALNDRQAEIATGNTRPGDASSGLDDFPCRTTALEQ